MLPRPHQTRRFWIALFILVPLTLLTLVALWGICGRSEGIFSLESKQGRYFWGGVLVWLVWWWKFPVPQRAYVFAHEATHVIVTWLFGGRVRQFHVGKDSGHVIITKSNFWISLAPYFVPFYSLLLGVMTEIWAETWNHGTWPTFAWTGLGISLASHLTFTIEALRAGQTDLRKEGVFFSIPIIVLGNIAWLLVLMGIFVPGSTHRFCQCWLECAQGFFSGLSKWIG